MELSGRILWTQHSQQLKNNMWTSNEDVLDANLFGRDLTNTFAVFYLLLAFRCFNNCRVNCHSGTPCSKLRHKIGSSCCVSSDYDIPYDRDYWILLVLNRHNLNFYLTIGRSHGRKVPRTSRYDVSFYNSTTSTWTLATPRNTWVSAIILEVYTVADNQGDL